MMRVSFSGEKTPVQFTKYPLNCSSDRSSYRSQKIVLFLQSLFGIDKIHNLHLGELILKFDQLVYAFRKGEFEQAVQIGAWVEDANQSLDSRTDGWQPQSARSNRPAENSRGGFILRQEDQRNPSAKYSFQELKNKSRVSQTPMTKLPKIAQLEYLVLLGQYITSERSSNVPGMVRNLKQLGYQLEQLKTELEHERFKLTQENLTSQRTGSRSPRTVKRKETELSGRNTSIQSKKLAVEDVDELLERLCDTHRVCRKPSCDGCSSKGDASQGSRKGSLSSLEGDTPILNQISAEQFFLGTLRNSPPIKVNSEKKKKSVIILNRIPTGRVRKPVIEVAKERPPVQVSKCTVKVEEVILEATGGESAGLSGVSVGGTGKTSSFGGSAPEVQCEPCVKEEESEATPNPSDGEADKLRMMANIIAKIGHMQSIENEIKSKGRHIRKSLVDFDTTRLQLMIESVQKGFGDVKSAMAAQEQTQQSRAAEKEAAVSLLSRDVAEEVARVAVALHSDPPVTPSL